MREKLNQDLKDCGAVQFGRFVLTSGAVSDYYIDIKNASTNLDTLRKITEEFSEYVSGYDILAGMELGAVPLVVALALETNVPYVIIRKKKREHGTGKQIEGGSVKGKRALIIEDVTTSGGSTVKGVEFLREAGAVVDKALVVVDRESGAKEKLKELDVELYPLLSVSEILKDRKKS